MISLIVHDALLSPAALAAGYAGTPVRQARPPDRAGGTEIALTVTPRALVHLGGGRYALIATEDDELGSHADRGAIAVAYLNHVGGKWQLIRRWNELAWTGNTGRAADNVISRATGDRHLVFAVSQAVQQGEFTTTAWAIELGKRGPKMVGEFAKAGSLDADNGCAQSICGSYGYEGTIRGATVPGALFSVIYRGWDRQPESHSKTTFERTVNFKLHRGELQGSPNPKLPGGTYSFSRTTGG